MEVHGHCSWIQRRSRRARPSPRARLRRSLCHQLDTSFARECATCRLVRVLCTSIVSSENESSRDREKDEKRARVTDTRYGLRAWSCIRNERGGVEASQRCGRTSRSAGGSTRAASIFSRERAVRARLRREWWEWGKWKEPVLDGGSCGQVSRGAAVGGGHVRHRGDEEGDTVRGQE